MTAEDWLKRALVAKTDAARARCAQRGLATRAPLDPTTHALLLRQLSLGYFAARRFDEAYEVALQALELDVLPDVIHQDAARALVASGDIDQAVLHLRSAARRAPASRRAFHLWTLGSVLFCAQRYADSVAALTRAVRWATDARPLYKAHLALVRVASGERVPGLQGIVDALLASPQRRGYGRFVLGHLAYAAGNWRAARKYLSSFVRSVEGARSGATALALAPELSTARATLSKMAAN